VTTLTEVPQTCSPKFPTHGAAGRRVADWPEGNGLALRNQQDAVAV
jgi:hypothetical protein